MEHRWEGRKGKEKKGKTLILLLIDCKLHKNKNYSCLVPPEPKVTKASTVSDILLNKYYRWMDAWMMEDGWRDGWMGGWMNTLIHRDCQKYVYIF